MAAVESLAISSRKGFCVCISYSGRGQQVRRSLAAANRSDGRLLYGPGGVKAKGFSSKATVTP
jgi:hypothetical protein